MVVLPAWVLTKLLTEKKQLEPNQYPMGWWGSHRNQSHSQSESMGHLGEKNFWLEGISVEKEVLYSSNSCLLQTKMYLTAGIPMNGAD